MVATPPQWQYGSIHDVVTISHFHFSSTKLFLFFSFLCYLSLNRYIKENKGNNRGIGGLWTGITNPSLNLHHKYNPKGLGEHIRVIRL